MKIAQNLRSSVVAPLSAVALAMSVAACSGGEAPAEEVAGETGVPGMSVENARLVLAPVAGNPAAVYFDLSYDGERALTIRKAEVAGAESTMLHDYNEFEGKMQMMEALPIGITKGDKLEFKPGEKHIMVFGLPGTVAPGGSVDVTLTVSGGATQTFPAEVRAAGEER
ncbi:copper chaperone PCu(A)C [Altererythrobacter sp. GH1-8]|uniref:copper chaperone PCu(A)C n=1 Tax=Altererythrobacter sp. GH1-8 TaxID=3349333 RepID=UPI00374DD0B6